MNRANLIACAAALMVAWSAPTPAQDLPPNEATWSHAVNLMEMIDLSKDMVSGDWRFENGSLITAGQGSKGIRGHSLIQIPYEPPAEYDFRIVFTRLSGRGDVVQVLAKNDHAFSLIMAAMFNTVVGFSLVNGKHVNSEENPTCVKFGGLRPDQRYSAVVSVREDGVKAYLDGKLMTQLRTHYENLSPFGDVRLADNSLLGFGAYTSGEAFHRIELLEVTGKGKPKRATGTLRLSPSQTPSPTGPSAGATLTTSTGMELVWIPAGEFVMGSTPEEKAWAISNGLTQGQVKVEGETPQRIRITSGFWLGRTELTTGQWKKFIEATGYVTDIEKAGESNLRNPKGGAWHKEKGVSWHDTHFGFPLRDDHPVCYLSWNDAIAYCSWLTETEKKSGRLPAGMVCRLPTESEWEYSCRGGAQTKFWWGDTMEEGNGRLNCGDNRSEFEFVSPVDHYGSRGRNAFGLADMLGNVWEWCLDDLDPAQAHAECYKVDGNARILRGGSFSDRRNVRSAYRRGLPPGRGDCDFGFRVCVGVPGGSGRSLGTVTSVAKTSSETGKASVPTAAGSASQNEMKDFARNQSSIKGLFIRITSTGQHMGGAQDIIATVERTSTSRETACDIFADAAKDTKISMEEAERLLKVRYPVWQSGRKIRFSYGDKYVKQAGGSAGGAFSVLLLSLFDGFQIDPGFAMTGDVTVDGKIREIGAAAEKIRGAMLEKCSVVAIPLSNKENLNDLAILYSPAMFWSIQILSVSTLDNAAAVARLDRDRYLASALTSFYQIQRALGPNAPVAYLRNRDTYMALQQVVQLAPNHLSAEFMLRAANNQLPNTLSLPASIEEIWAASALMRGYLLDDKAPDAKKNTRYVATQLPAEAIKVALDRLTWLDTRLHPKTKELKNAMYDYIQSLDTLRRQGGVGTTGYSHNLAKRDKVLGEFIKLGTDRNALEELMH